MIDCKECIEYAHSVLARGEIEVKDVNKLAVDRHVLKGCTTAQTIVSICDAAKIPTDIICNGFSIKQTIIDVLNEFPQSIDLCQDSEAIAEAIKEAFAVKLRLKQGKPPALPCEHTFVLVADDPECISCGITYEQHLDSKDRRDE